MNSNRDSPVLGPARKRNFRYSSTGGDVKSSDHPFSWASRTENDLSAVGSSIANWFSLPRRSSSEPFLSRCPPT